MFKELHFIHIQVLLEKYEKHLLHESNIAPSIAVSPRRRAAEGALPLLPQSSSVRFQRLWCAPRVSNANLRNLTDSVRLDRVRASLIVTCPVQWFCIRQQGRVEVRHNF